MPLLAVSQTAAMFIAMLMPWMLLFARAGAEICTALIGVLFLWHSWRARDWAWVRTPFMRVALLAWAWLVLVVSPLGLSPEISVFFALPWIRYVLLFMALRYWVLRHPKALQRLALSVALMLLYVAADGLFQYHSGHSFFGHPIAANDRLTGPFHMPKVGIFSARFLLPLVLMASLLFYRQVNRLALFCMPVTALSMTIIVLSGERTALGLTILSLLLGSALVTRFAEGLRRPMMWSAGAMLLLVGALYTTQPTVQHTLYRTTKHVSYFKESPYGQVFSAAFQVGKQHWMTGVGMQGLRQLTPNAVAGQDGSAGVEHFIHAHNPYLEWFAEAGLPGLLLFIAMVGLLVREAALQLAKAQGAAVLAPAFMLAACLFHFFPIMSTQSYFSNWTGITIWYCLGVVFASPYWVNGLAIKKQDATA